MRTTTNPFKDIISLCLSLCVCLIAFSAMANSNTTNFTPLINEDDPTGNVSISMVTVGSFPDYGVSIPFNITIENQGSNDVYDVIVSNTIPAGYTFDPSGTAWVVDGINPNVYNNTIAGPIAAASTALITINLVPIAAPDSTDWINTAEITEFRDGPGGTVCLDSDLSDNMDMVAVSLFDLALRKELITPTPHCYGQLLTFRTYIMNQGNTPATAIEIIDFVPEGYDYDAATNAPSGWTGTVTPTVVLPGQLNSNEETFIDIQLTLTMEMFDGMAWNNYTTINSASDDNGVDRTPFDADSNLGSNSITENSVLPGDADDNNMNGGGPNAGEDEDDHDPAAPVIYDLALKKVLLTALPSFSYGEEATFRNTVYNQGNQTVANIEIVDYIPCGFEFIAANNLGWSYNSVSRIAHYTMPAALTPSTNDFVDIVLIVVQCYNNQATAWSNYAEVAGATDMAGIAFVDIDSVMDSILINDQGAVDGTPTDNQLDGGGPKANEDEDDHDIKMLEVVDLAIKKRILETGPFNFGDTISFVNTIFNQGNVVLDSIRIRDYMRSGYTFAADINPTWSLNGSGYPEGLIPTMLFPEDSINYELKLILTPATTVTDYYNFAEIFLVQDTTNSFTRNRFDDADSFVGSHFFPGSTEPNVVPESADDDNIFGDGFDGEDSDDNDVAALIFYDLALTKNLVDPIVTIEYGMPLAYVITVTNEGTMEANGIRVTDYLPCGLSFDLADNTGWNIDPVTGYVFFDIPTTITPGGSIELIVNLTLEECENSDSESYTNVAEISVDDGDDRDSTPDDTPGDDPDEDDIDSEPLLVYDLSLTKTISSTAVSYSMGDPITFTIEVTNEGGESVQNVKVVDYLPCGFGFMAAGNLGWSLNAITGLLEYTSIELLAPGETFSADLTLTLQPCATSGEDNYLNGAEISEAQDTEGDVVGDTDSTPDEIQGNEIGDEDDYDEIGVDIYDLSLDKTLTTPVTSFTYDQVVSYDITVTNEGTMVATGIEVTDYIPCGLSYDASNNSINWVLDPISGYASYTIPTDIAPGASETIIILLTLEPCTQEDPGKYNNKAEISIDNGDDDDSYPDDDPENDPPGEDDNDDEPLAIYDLALTKTVQGAANSFSVDDVVTFEIEVTNEGNRTVQNVNVIDYVPCGLSTANQVNTGWIAIAGTNNITYPISSMAPGQTLTIEVSFLIVSCNIDSDDNYANESEITDFEGENGDEVDDIDSTPDDIPGDPESEDDNDTEILLLSGSLGGDVWKDLDFDGIHDTNEPSITGMTVNLYGCNGNFIRSTTTGQTGFYIFLNLPADNYQVQFDLSSLGEPCVFTEPNVGGNDAIDSDAGIGGFSPCTEVTVGSENYTVDAGLIEALGLIGDFVFTDFDADGIQDFGDSGIGGMAVYLYTEGGFLVASTMTDSQGGYNFVGVSEGYYYIEFGAMAILLPTLVDATNDTRDSDVTGNNGPNTTDIFYLAPGEVNNDIDAGFYECATVCGYTWLDLANENDLRDPTENGLNGMKVRLFRIQNGVSTKYDEMYTGLNPDTPSDDGYFNFCVPPGRYYLEFVLPAIGLVQVLPLSGPQDINSDVNNYYGVGTTSAFNIGNGGEKCDLGAGYTLMSEVGNAVWLDQNQNGLRESFEEPLSGVVVQAYDLNNVMIAEAVSDDNGLYNIDYLQKKDYYLKFTAQDGMVFTQALVGGDDALDSDVDHSYGPNTTRAFLGAPGVINRNMDAGIVFGVLPVEWGSIIAKNDGDHNLVSWSTLTEVNNERFLVQRSQTGNGSFATIGEMTPLEANSTSLQSYDFQDKNLVWSQYYYRIVQVDIDGRESYSDVVAVKISKEGFTVYPNPTDRELRISSPLLHSLDEITINVYDQIGKLVIESYVELQSNIEVTIPVMHLNTGIYSIEILDGGVVLHTQRFIRK